jgi:hypothetical protein
MTAASRPSSAASAALAAAARRSAAADASRSGATRTASTPRSGAAASDTRRSAATPTASSPRSGATPTASSPCSGAAASDTRRSAATPTANTSPSGATPAASARRGPASAGGSGSRPVSPTAADLWRRWRVPLALVALILLGGTVTALLKPTAVITGYLDPAGTDAPGAHALADILSDRGDKVVRVTTPAAAAAAAAGPGDVTLVITSPQLITTQQLASLTRIAADRVLVGPDQAALTALAPAVRLAGTAPVQALLPGCRLTAAQLAGNADMGGLRLELRTAPQPTRGRRPGAGTPAQGGPELCYPGGGSASLVRYTVSGRVITVLGSGNALTNGSLAQLGNASLAINLLGGRSRIVWLVPEPTLPGGGLPSHSKSLLDLIPLPAYLVAIQLGVAAVLAALWRARRLGPLVPERLPVVVRASETAEGHAGLYRSRRARGSAAAALRAAMLARTLPALGLAPDARPSEVMSAVSARSGSAGTAIEAMLFGPAPRDDAALVALADDLDALEREVRSR